MEDLRLVLLPFLLTVAAVAVEDGFAVAVEESFVVLVRSLPGLGLKVNLHVDVCM